mgnify:CR=1 FL=1
MGNLNMYFGTFSDEKMEERKKTKKDANCFTCFFARNISTAKKMANELGLKNFSPLGQVYSKGEDF